MVNFDYKTINKTSDTDTEHFIKAQDMNFVVKWSLNQMPWFFLTMSKKKDSDRRTNINTML